MVRLEGAPKRGARSPCVPRPGVYDLDEDGDLDLLHGAAATLEVHVLFDDGI